MVVKETKFSIIFPKNTNIRRHVFDLEDNLKDYFQVPLNMLPIPESAPEEIPRITGISKEGHSNISLSLVNAQIDTKFDENFALDWNKCFDYLKKRIQETFLTLKKDIIKEGFLFAGLTTQIILDSYLDPVKLIADKFLKDNKSDFFDINFRSTLVIEEKYYVNITIFNQRVLHETTNKKFVSKGNYLAIDLDINNRYAHNFNESNVSTYDDIERVLDITNDIIINKVDSIINEGVISL